MPTRPTAAGPSRCCRSRQFSEDPAGARSVSEGGASALAHASGSAARPSGGYTSKIPSRTLFVTGKLAEPSLRRVLADLAPKAGFEPEVAVLPITVAALMTTEWVGRRLRVPAATQRVILPGYCRGDVAAVPTPETVRVEKGPKDLRDLPEFFGGPRGRPKSCGRYDIEIGAEINHTPGLPPADILAAAGRFRDNGADVIDLGCNPGETWAGIGEAVRDLRADGLRVSVDSFNPIEVESALAAGAELV